MNKQTPETVSSQKKKNNHHLCSESVSADGKERDKHDGFFSDYYWQIRLGVW